MKSKKDFIAQTGNTLYEKLSSCGICPRGCGVNRLEGQKDFCRTGSQPEVSGYEPRFGEAERGAAERGTLILNHVGKRADLVGGGLLRSVGG